MNIIELAREAYCIDFRDDPEDPHVKQMIEFLERFAALVLEEAARCCDAEEKRGQHNMTCDIPKNYEFWNGGAMFAGQLAEEIRALKGAKE